MKYYLLIIALCFVSCSNKRTQTSDFDSERDIAPISNWMIGNHTDKYGDITDSHFLYKDLKGSINWSDSRGSSGLKGFIYITKDSYKLFRYIDFVLYDNYDYPLIGELSSSSQMKFTNKKGEEIEVDLMGSEGRYSISPSKVLKVLEMLKEGGSIKVSGYLHTKGSRTATLRFSIDDSFGLQEMMDSVYAIENTDTIAALKKNDSIMKEWNKSR